MRAFKFPLSFINKSIISLKRNFSLVKDALRKPKGRGSKIFSIAI
jgi:hypothetical protein